MCSAFLFVFINHPSRKKRKQPFGCFLFFAEGEGFLLWQATASVTNPFWFFISHAKKQPFGCFLFFAEGEGFKPPIRDKAYTGFRVQRIRSLCQPSFLRYAKLVKKLQNAKLFFEKMWLVCVRIFFAQYMLAHRCGMMWFVRYCSVSSRAIIYTILASSDNVSSASADG